MLDHDKWFILRIMKNQPDTNLATLWETHRDHGGLSNDRAAGDIMHLIETEDISVTMQLTDKGKEYLNSNPAN
jgi:hypothetical protein